MKKRLLYCAIIFTIGSSLLTGCNSTEVEVQNEENVEVNILDAAQIPTITVSANSQMKDFEIVIHGVENERQYLDTLIQVEDQLITLTEEKSFLLDAYGPAMVDLPGYPLTIKCIPNDGVEECADRIVVNCDFGGLYVRENEQFVLYNQEAETKANYTCYYSPVLQTEEGISQSDVSNIQIAAYKGDEAVKVIKLKVTKDDDHYYISIVPE